MRQRTRVMRWLVLGCAMLPASCGDNTAVRGDASTHDAELDAAGDAAGDAGVDAFIAPIGSPCNPLTQAGCSAGQKCSWIIDALTPSYVGRVGCAPTGTATVGASCMFGAPGATGYDNCATGLVCGNYRGGTGTCKTVCDAQGGNPVCDASRVCSTYAGLFSTDPYTPAAAGVCDLACNPLEDNDFDGSGSDAKGSNICGSADSVGCYGYPSYGTPPATGWTCVNDINFGQSPPMGLRHRVACTEANGCADPGPVIYVNSCNQGYLPLLYDQTGSTTIICVAMCKPAICYSGNCGVSDTNRQGDPTSAHECTAADRLGTDFQATEHCQYLWWREVDDSGNLLQSPTSDTVGICMDFAKYRYDSNGDNKLDTSDMVLPNCDALGSGFGSGSNRLMPTTYFGAADLGCVPSSYVPLAAYGKADLPQAALQKRALINLPRALYHRTLGN